MSHSWKDVTLGEVSQFLGDKYVIVMTMPNKLHMSRGKVTLLTADSTYTFEALNEAFEELGELVQMHKEKAAISITSLEDIRFLDQELVWEGSEAKIKSGMSESCLRVGDE
jgi:hypothetical protein